ncbi:MAG: type II secretion system protein [Planctomycetota bacterium]
MSTAHAMTLLETLAATALLGVIAAAVLPLVQAAGVDRAPADAGLAEAELSILVDRVLEDPVGFGVDEDGLATPRALGSVFLETPIDGRIVELGFEVLVPSASGPDAAHTWTVWSVGGVRTLRWTPLPDTESGGGGSSP